MELYQIGIIFVFLILGLVVGRSAYLRGLTIQEAGKTERSRANAYERSNQTKMNGLFEMQIAKLASVAGGDDKEIEQFLQLFTALKGGAAGSGNSAPGAVTWDMLKEQLKNPEVKNLIKEHQEEALNILKE